MAQTEEREYRLKTAKLHRRVEEKIAKLSKEGHAKLLREYREFLQQKENFPGSKTLTPLCLANRDRRYHLAKFILENKMEGFENVNLHYTVINQNKRFFDLYISEGIDPNKDGAFVTSFEKRQNKTGHYFDTLINHPDFDINTVGLESNSLGDKNTYLMYASIKASSKQYREILERISPDLISARNERDKSAAYFAFEFGFTDLIKALLERKPELTAKDLSKLSNENTKLLRKHYGEKEYTALMGMRAEYLTKFILSIIKDIEMDTLDHSPSEELRNRTKDALYPRYKKISNIDHKLLLNLWSGDLTKEKSLEIFRKLLETIENPQKGKQCQDT